MRINNDNLYFPFTPKNKENEPKSKNDRPLNNIINKTCKNVHKVSNCNSF